MAVEQFDGNYGGTIEIDVCHTCNGIWFDGRESLMLPPRATMALFRSMHARAAQARVPLQEKLACPHCAGALLETHDRQRDTKFSYYRCEEHGRFTTFFQFLREKNLVRQASPKQLDELKAQLKIITCSNCGAPIALDQAVAACAHCRAPICVLGGESLEQTLRELDAAQAKRTSIDPMVGINMMHDRLKIEQLFSDKADLPYPRARYGGAFATDLIWLSLNLLSGFFK